MNSNMNVILFIYMLIWKQRSRFCSWIKLMLKVNNYNPASVHFSCTLTVKLLTCSIMIEDRKRRRWKLSSGIIRFLISFNQNFCYHKPIEHRIINKYYHCRHGDMRLLSRFKAQIVNWSDDCELHNKRIFARKDLLNYYSHFGAKLDDQFMESEHMLIGSLSANKFAYLFCLL
jgi:hypothetical protein